MNRSLRVFLSKHGYCSLTVGLTDPFRPSNALNATAAGNICRVAILLSFVLSRFSRGKIYFDVSLNSGNIATLFISAEQLHPAEMCQKDKQISLSTIFFRPYAIYKTVKVFEQVSEYLRGVQKITL